MGFLIKKKSDPGTLDFTNEQYQRILKEAVLLENGKEINLVAGASAGENKVVDFSGASNGSNSSSGVADTASAFSFLDNLAGAGSSGSAGDSTAYPAVSNSSESYPSVDESKARIIERISNKLNELDAHLIELKTRLEQVESQLRGRYSQGY